MAATDIIQTFITQLGAMGPIGKGLYFFIGFVVLLLPLVVIHEFGHFIFAKIFGVKAEVFSIGFGQSIFKKQIGETEWRLAWIPLGGFVKLLGDDPEADLPPELQNRALGAQAPWKRFFIFAGGPLFNLIFAVFIFGFIAMLGEPQISNVIGRVYKNSPAEQAGLMSGDRVLSVNEKAVQKYSEFDHELDKNPDRSVELKIKRTSIGKTEELITVSTVLSSRDWYSQIGKPERVGVLDGIDPFPRGNTVGISNPNSEAAKLGLKTKDQIFEINGNPVKSWEEIEALYSALSPGSVFAIKWLNIDKKEAQGHFTKTNTQSTLSDSFGLHSSELFIEEVIPDSPAKTIGLQSGDRLLTINSQPIFSFAQLRSAIQKYGNSGEKISVTWERMGQILKGEAQPNQTTELDPSLKQQKQFSVGIRPMLSLVEPEMILERETNPALALIKGTEKMIDFTQKNFQSIWGMIKQEVPHTQLGGPIMIAKIAGESIDRGLVVFLTTMAIISVGLGVLNILPVPVLDGGHILLLIVEMIRRKPLTLRQMALVQQFGLALILSLIVIVFKNDIIRAGLWN